MVFLMSEAAEVLKIGFYPDKLLACWRFMKICDLFVFGKCGVRPISMPIKHTERRRYEMIRDICMTSLIFCKLKNTTYHFISFPPNSPVWPFLKFSMLIAYTDTYNLSCNPDSQGQWKPSVCYLRSNRTGTRLQNVIAVDVGLVVLVRMISVFLTRRDITRIEAVHWEWGSPNKCVLFQGWTCTRVVKLLRGL